MQLAFRTGFLYTKKYVGEVYKSMQPPKFVVIMLVLIGIMLFTASTGFMFAADTNEDNSLHQATATAMSKAINMGQLRVDEEITINEKVVKETLIREYVNQSNFHDGEKRLNIYAINSQPAMIGVESYNTFAIPIKKYLKEPDDQTTVRQFENMIFEAKKVTK
ncbi:hypothetical protein FOL75_15435 [Bacillus thuringiensis]|uniref:DUF5411 family protein n=2 Tax=Bacillus TaxID=1386 RepID=UPI0009AEF20F|nr:hypothetical protein [Bacillus thuringiensis]HDR4351144.1 hypothetical protein [Bacillus cereus]HDR6957300.1 hypothetical protein [Bacillus cereus]